MSQVYAICAGFAALIALWAAAIAVRQNSKTRKILRVFIDGPPDETRPEQWGI